MKCFNSFIHQKLLLRLICLRMAQPRDLHLRLREGKDVHLCSMVLVILKIITNHHLARRLRYKDKSIVNLVIVRQNNVHLTKE